MQVCTSLQTDNDASTPPFSFLQAGCRSAAQPTVSKHWRYIRHAVDIHSPAHVVSGRSTASAASCFCHMWLACDVGNDQDTRINLRCSVHMAWFLICWLQRAYGEDINSQNSRFIIDFLRSRVPIKKVCKSLCSEFKRLSGMSAERLTVVCVGGWCCFVGDFSCIFLNLAYCDFVMYSVRRSLAITVLVKCIFLGCVPEPV